MSRRRPLQRWRPSRREALGASAYAACLALVASGVYEPLTQGRDETWLIAVSVVAAHLGLGAAIPRAGTLLVPATLCVALFLLGGAEALAWLYLVLGVPILTGITALGIVLAVGAKARAGVVAGSVFAVAAVPAAIGIEQTISRSTAPHVGERVQRALMTDWSPDNLCQAHVDRRTKRRLRRAVDVLERELREHPGHRVDYVYDWADGPSERATITVRELAEEHLLGLGVRDACSNRIRARIEAAL